MRKRSLLGRNSLLSGPSLTWGTSTEQNYIWRLICIHACMLSCVQFFTILWTVARQAPPSLRLLGRNTGVGCHFLLLRIFSTQGSNPCHLRLLRWQAGSSSLSHLGGWYSKYFKTKLSEAHSLTIWVPVFHPPSPAPWGLLFQPWDLRSTWLCPGPIVVLWVDLLE